MDLQQLIPSTSSLDNEEDAELLSLLDKALILPSEQLEQPDYTLSQDGIGFAPRGNIMALTAEMKHGKTFVFTILTAALLRGEYCGLNGMIESPRLLFFDTEQDRNDGQRIQRRIQTIMNWDYTDDSSHLEQFRIYHLREYAFDKRRAMIGAAIRKYKPDVVFIDGLRDLLVDFNDLKESSELIQWMMEQSSVNHCAIWTVLHSNPGSEKMRGHSGTELGNKASDVFRVHKNKLPNSSVVTFDVEHAAARHRDIAGWTFKIDDELPYGIPVLATKEDEKAIETASDARKEELRGIIRKYMHEAQACSYRKILEMIRTGEKIAQSKAKSILNEMIGQRILEKVFDGKYRITNCDMPDSVQSEIPF